MNLRMRSRSSLEAASAKDIGTGTSLKGSTGRKPHRARMMTLTSITTFLALLWLSPFWFVTVNSFKEFGAILKDAAGWPDPFILDNYPTAWESAGFVSAFLNSLFVTLTAVPLMIGIGAMAAWRLARTPHRVTR